LDKYLTPADLIAEGLGLSLAEGLAAEEVPVGTTCAITGQPITHGFRVADMVTDATAEFLDCFRGGVHGWVSENAARCFKNADPRRGNPTARSFLIFEDGPCYVPLINREAAKEQGRACWSDLVRGVWPEYQGRTCLAIITTDTKKRLWIRARVGALGCRTPALLYDSELALNEIRMIDWRALLDCLDLVEEVYTHGFGKEAIIENLFGGATAAKALGFLETSELERRLGAWRSRSEFPMAVLIAQKKEEASSCPRSR